MNSDSLKIINDTDHEDFLKHVFRQYQFWGKSIYFISDVKKLKSGFSNALSCYIDNSSVRLISKYKSNKYNDSYYAVYLYQPDSLPVLESDDTHPSDNQIINGDMEEILPSDKIAQKFRNWTNGNALFYKSDHLKLPSHQSLLATWNLQVLS